MITPGVCRYFAGVVRIVFYGASYTPLRATYLHSSTYIEIVVAQYGSVIGGGDVSRLLHILTSLESASMMCLLEIMGPLNASVTEPPQSSVL